MDLVQFHVGSELNFWDLPFAQYGCLAPRGWIKHTWECLADTPLSLRGPSLALPKLRHGDVFLMDAFVNQGYEDEDLCALNDCRLHLKIHRLSEIATACCNRIEPRAWAGKSSWSWPPTRWIGTYLPTSEKWELWREALRATFLHPATDSLLLRSSLGNWLKPHDPHWIWWKHSPSQTLYEQRTPGQWFRWSRHPSTAYRDKFKEPEAVTPEAVPSHRHRASVKRPSRSQYVTGLTTGTATTPPVIHPATTLPSVLKALPEDAHWAISTITQTDNGASTNMACGPIRATMQRY